MSNHSLHVGSVPGSLTDLGGSSYGLTVLRHGVTWMPEVQGQGNDLPGVAGGYTDGMSFRARELSVPCIVRGSSATDLRTRLDAILALLDGTGGDQWFKFDWQSDRLWVGRVWGSVDGDSRMTWARLTLVFRFADALSYDATETTYSWGISDPSDTTVMPPSGVIAGSADALPVWTLTNISGTTSTLISVANETTGETITISGWAMTSGHVLRLDRARQLVQRNTGSGLVTWYSGVGSSTQIPRLQHGTTNSITVSGIGTGQMIFGVAYRARYL